MGGVGSGRKSEGKNDRKKADSKNARQLRRLIREQKRDRNIAFKGKRTYL